MDAVPQPGRRRRSFLFACVGGCAIGVVATEAQAQSLFEVLFGRQSLFAPAPPFYQPHYAPRPAPLHRSGEPAPRGIESVDAKPEKYVPPEVMPGPLRQFLRDPTLRRGDVVATSKGLMVFRGPGGARHSERDFVALSNASGFTAGNKANLVALERTLKRGHTSQHVGETLAERVRAVPVAVQEKRQEKKKRGR